MSLSPNFLHAIIYRLPWVDKSNKPCFTGTPTPYLPHHKLVSLLTNQGALEAQVTEALKTDIYEQNIRGGHNTTIIRYFSSSA